MAAWVSAGREDDLAPGQVRVVQAGEAGWPLCNVDGQLYCIDDVCTHDGGPLDQGELDGERDRVPASRRPLRRHDRPRDLHAGDRRAVKTYPSAGRRTARSQVDIDG